MSKKSHQIYIGDELRRAIEGLNVPLSEAINIVAERYNAVIDRQERMHDYCLHAELYGNVIEDIGRPLTTSEIATFTALCEDWLKRNGSLTPAPHKTAVMVTKGEPFHELLALVSTYERLIAKRKLKKAWRASPAQPPSRRAQAR